MTRGTAGAGIKKADSDLFVQLKQIQQKAKDLNCSKKSSTRLDIVHGPQALKLAQECVEVFGGDLDGEKSADGEESADGKQSETENGSDQETTTAEAKKLQHVYDAIKKAHVADYKPRKDPIKPLYNDTRSIQDFIAANPTKKRYKITGTVHGLCLCTDSLFADKYTGDSGMVVD